MFGYFLGELDGHVDAAGRIGAAVDVLHALGGAGVDDGHEVAAGLEHRNHRIEIRQRVDLAALHDRDRAGGRADADGRHGIGLQSCLREQDVDEHCGRRTWRGDADLHALQVRRRLVLRGLGLVHPEHDRRVFSLQHQRLDVLALGLLRDRVLVRAGDDVDAAAQQRLQRARTAREVLDLDVESFRLEIALLLGDGQRQVIEQRLAADADRELRLLGRLSERCRRHRRCQHAQDQREQRQQTATHRLSPHANTAFSWSVLWWRTAGRSNLGTAAELTPFGPHGGRRRRARVP